MVRRRVVVRGVVQGVGFRVALARAARTRGVAGWVRNRPDGTVEAELEGPGRAVDAMLEWCGHGPRSTRVDDVAVRDVEPQGASSFEIR